MELWDIYDNRRRLTGGTHIRGEAMGEGENHLVVGVIIYNSKAEILITRRSHEKESNPGRWENTVGSALAGEDGKTAAIRELAEETGIRLKKLQPIMVIDRIKCHRFVNIYIGRQDVELKDIELQPGETCAAEWVSLDRWEQMYDSGELFSIVKGQFHELAARVRSYINKILI